MGCLSARLMPGGFGGQVSRDPRALAQAASAWERGCRLANGLIALGLEPRERVAVLEDNSKEAADFFLRAGIANLVRVPSNRAIRARRT